MATVAWLIAGTPLLAFAHPPADPAPKTPKGLQRCTQPLLPAGDLPRRAGDRFEYEVQVLGVNLGTVLIETSRRGWFDQHRVTEYRGSIDPDPMISALLSVEARAANLIPDAQLTPVRSMTRYRFRNDTVREDQERAGDGSRLKCKRTENGKTKSVQRNLPTPTFDFLTGFQFLRRLPQQATGCAVVYGHQRAYTVWITPDGTEQLDTPQGRREFERYLLRYGSDKTKKVRTVRLWITSGKERVPYQIRGINKYEPVVRLRSFRTATPTEL